MSELDYYPTGGVRASDVAEPDVPLSTQISRLEKKMKEAAKRLELEEAAEYRDRLKELRELQIYSEG